MRVLFSYLTIVILLFSCADSSEDAQDGGIKEFVEEMEMEAPIEEILEEEVDEDFASIETQHVLFCNIGLYQEPAVMVLNWGASDENGTSSIDGYYFYVRHQKNLDLEGYSESKTRAIYLTESYKGKKSGYMEFYQDDVEDESYWAVSEDSEDQQDFNSEDLFFQDPSEANLAIEREQYRYPHGIQVYNGEDWDDEEVEDELNYVIINDEYFAFDMHVTRANAHMGSISGYTKISNSNEVIWKDNEGCVLTFDMSESNEISVQEEGCEYYHGARAQFDGTYKKQ